MIIKCLWLKRVKVKKYYGKSIDLNFLRQNYSINRTGVTLGGLAEAAESIGLKSYGARINIDTLKNEVPLPCIVNWRQRHYIVIYQINKGIYTVADPAYGIIKYIESEFLSGWIPSKNIKSEDEGIVLLLEPSVNFLTPTELAVTSKSKLAAVLPYFLKYSNQFFYIFLTLLIVTLIQLVLPFLTQSVVDTGIQNQNINFINLILIAQLVLFIGMAVSQILRDWFLLHITTRVNIQMLSDFIMKLMNLPLSYINSKNIGDILTRLQDHNRVQSFISTSSFNAVFSLLTILVFSIVLAIYKLDILVVFLLGTTSLFVIWTLFFLKRRKLLDYRLFDLNSGNQSSVVQLLYGMQEIKMNGSEKRRRWEWEAIQARTYKVAVKTLALQQMQLNGGSLINEVKNIVITFLAASSVINGQISLGAMMSIQFIIGQLNVPVNALVNFIQSTQDALISLDRINEVHKLKDEIDTEKEYASILPQNRSIKIENLNFRYGSVHSSLVLKSLSISIPENTTTAIVGASGSGKTTLLKLILKILAPSSGSIKIGNTNLELINSKFWREQIGVVMQDGYIFSDTILRNITESDSDSLINKDKLSMAIDIANLNDIIDSLPLGLNTRIGASGINLSGGQNQRVFLARAIYKNPSYFFLDEATSALDATNEKEIMDKLYGFFQERTVIIVAHRLSTVINADNIIVLNKGEVIENGNHDELLAKKGFYFNLIKNQLALGS